MTIQTNFPLAVNEDASVTIPLTPPTAIGGWDLRFQVGPRPGFVSGYLTRSTASGFNNVSGVNIVNSGAGIFEVDLRSSDFSGLDQGAFWWQAERLDSGSRTVLANGWLLRG